MIPLPAHDAEGQFMTSEGQLMTEKDISKRFRVGGSPVKSAALVSLRKNLTGQARFKVKN
jgi:hypothetical protein